MGLTKVPIAETEESTQVQNKIWVKTILTKSLRLRLPSRRVKALENSSMTYIKAAINDFFNGL